MSGPDSPGVDEGGITQLAKTLNLSDNIGEMGSWAAIMQEEQMDLSIKGPNEEENKDDTIADEDNKPLRPRRIYHPPFIVRVSNIPFAANEEDLFFHFGGETAVNDMILNRGSAEVELHSPESLEKALDLDSKLFFGRTLTVRLSNTFNVNTNYNKTRNSQRHDSQSSHFSSDSRRYGSHSNRGSYGHRQDGGYGGHSGSYSARDSRDSYNMPPPSHFPNRRGGRGGYSEGGRDGGYPDRHGHASGHQNDGYQQYNNGYGGTAGYRSDRSGRGGYVNQRGGSHTDRGYNRRNDYYDDNTLQRSSSHQFDHRQDRPGSVVSHRSRTDSVSSHMTHDKRNEEVTSVQTKKPSSRSIFGDAKPVDTRVKEMEAEEKIRKERDFLHQQAEAERQAHHAQAAAAAAASTQAQSSASGQVSPVEQHQNPQYVAHHNQPRYHGSGQQNHNIGHDQRTHGHRKSFDSITTQDVSRLERKTSSPFDGPPGGVQILQRTVPTEDTADVHSDSSPPLDPIHPVSQRDDHRKEVLTFTRTNPLQKSSTTANVAADSSQRGGYSRGHSQRGSRGNRGGRGGVHHTERRASVTEGTHVNKAPKGGIHKQHQEKLERKDSVSSRGTGENRRGRGGKRFSDNRTHGKRDDIKRDENMNMEKIDEKSTKSSTRSDEKRDSVKEVKERAAEEKSVKEDLKSKAVEKSDSKKEVKKDGDAEKKKKGSQGEVGARKKKEEEKKKLQAMPTLKQTKPSFQTANKFAALMDAKD